MDDRMYAAWVLGRLGYSAWTTTHVLRLLPAIQRGHEAECYVSNDEARAHYSKAGDRAFANVCDSMRRPDSEPKMIVIRQTDPRGCPISLWVGRAYNAAFEPDFRLPAKGFTAAQMERIDARVGAR